MPTFIDTQMNEYFKVGVTCLFTYDPPQRICGTNNLTFHQPQSLLRAANASY